jgi:hypothetical protein
LAQFTIFKHTDHLLFIFFGNADHLLSTVLVLNSRKMSSSSNSSQRQKQ